MADSRNPEKQNVTISLSRNVLKKAKILAARRETSISRLLARELESLVGDEEAYERAERQALALLDKGFHLAARGRTTENARAVTKCAAAERGCHPQASRAIGLPGEETARHPA